MFSDLYDAISLLFSRAWPTAEGMITAVGAKAVREGYMLVVEYKFSVGNDGPYTGESDCPIEYVGDLTHFNDNLRVGRPVTVRYRRDNPSVNKVDRSMWTDLDSL